MRFVCKYFLLGLVLLSCGQRNSISERPNAGQVANDSISDTVSKEKVKRKTAFDENDYDSYLRFSNYLVEDLGYSGDFQEIDSTCAVLIYPTNQQVDKMKKEYGEEDFYIVADDGNYYQGTAVGMLDSLKVSSISAEKNVLKFVGKDTLWLVDIRKEGAPEWNIIFFNRKKSPEVVSVADLTYEQIIEYFDIKISTE
jgi:hypothetical protein